MDESLENLLSEHWQLNRNLVNCNRFMFEHEVAHDVCFKVGIEEESAAIIKAHKYVLVSRSPVFYAMFYGPLSVNNDDIIRISDVEEVAFKYMLRYMYCDEAELSEDVVLPILYASKKYMLPSLTDQCIEFLEANLQPDNVCTIYEHSLLYEVERLVNKCVTFIETRTDDILSSSAFCDISLQSLLKILKFEKLTIQELDLFKACVKWSSEECKRQDKDITCQHQREVLGEALYLIHFPTLSLSDFANVVSQTGILTAEEKCSVYDYMACDDAGVKHEVKRNIVFPLAKRQKPKPSVLRRFQTFSKASVYSGDCNILKIQCDHTVILKGLGVSGSCNYDPLAEVQIAIKQDRMLLCNRSLQTHDEKTGDVIQIPLPDTIVLKPNMWYTVIATFHFFGDHDQGCCKRGKGGNKSLSCDGVCFEFDRADSAGFVNDICFCKI